MARKIKRFNLPGPVKLRRLIPVIVLVFVSAAVFNWLKGFIIESPYFRVNRIEIAIIGRGGLSDRAIKELLSINKGRNIFNVDLKATQKYITVNYPEVRSVVINRGFPDKLVLNVRPRRPIAQVSVSNGFYLVDTEGVILPGPKDLVFEDLPIITGVDQRVILSDIGKRCGHMGLKRGLKLLEIIGQMKFSQDHEVHMIDASDEKNLSLYIEGGVEIKIGGEGFRERIVMLNKTFSAGRLDKNQIRYIDLRFGNVIVGPK